jgi:hypothetical protein
MANKKKQPTEKEAREFVENVHVFLQGFMQHAIDSYFCEHHQDHGLTHGQFIQTVMITYMAEQSVIFDRHNEKVNKKLEKKKRTMK